MESSRYIPRDHLHMRTTEIDFNSAAVMAPKKTDNAKKRTADARAKRFWVYRFFWSVMRANNICVWRYFYTLPFCLHLNVPITWSLQSACMMKSPLIFKQGNQSSTEREVKKKYLYFIKPICLWASLNCNHTKNNI